MESVSLQQECVFSLTSTTAVSVNSFISSSSTRRDHTMHSFIASILVPFMASTGGSSEPDFTMVTAELIRYYGYPAETYDLFTPDDYRIRIFRIPHGIQGNPVVKGRPVVFLLSGLQGSSDNWVNQTPNVSLGYVLADLGFDVWLGNVRGTIYGRRHKHLDPDHDLAFWDFTFDQNGALDLPAMLRFSMKKSGKTNLQLVAFSMGTASAFAMLSTMDEFNAKISMYHSFAAAVRVDLCVSDAAVPLIKLRHPVIVPELNIALHGELRSYNDTKKVPMASEIIAIIGVEKRKEEEDPNKPKSRSLPGSSVSTYDHVLQVYDEHTFTKYRYILETTNVQKYGSPNPPAYVLRNVDVPVILYYSKGDETVCVEAVKGLAPMLRPEILRGVLEIGDKNFTHYGYLGKGDSRKTMKIFIDRLVKNA